MTPLEEKAVKWLEREMQRATFRLLYPGITIPMELTTDNPLPEELKDDPSWIKLRDELRKEPE